MTHRGEITQQLFRKRVHASGLIDQLFLNFGIVASVNFQSAGVSVVFDLRVHKLHLH